MMEGTDRETRPAGREISVLAYGDTADEIELAALDEARPFFGEAVRLTVVPEWRAFDCRPGAALSERSGGKRYYASVTVRTVEPGD